MRLDQLEMAFESRAIKDKDVAAGVLMVKIAERRATLLGLNPVQGHAVHIIEHDRPTTSTSKLEDAINRIRGPNVPALGPAVSDKPH